MHVLPTCRSFISIHFPITAFEQQTYKRERNKEEVAITRKAYSQNDPNVMAVPPVPNRRRFIGVSFILTFGLDTRKIEFRILPAFMFDRIISIGA
jgi:hypothetical protein